LPKLNRRLLYDAQLQRKTENGSSASKLSVVLLRFLRRASKDTDELGP